MNTCVWPRVKTADAVHARHVVPTLHQIGADLVGLAAVGTDLLVHDHHAQLFLFHRLDDLLEVLVRRIFEHRALISASFFFAARDRCGARELRRTLRCARFLDDAHRLGDVLLERLLRPTSSSFGVGCLSSGNSRLALPAFFASSSIAATIFLISSCANATASRKSSSEISLPPPSTIITRVGRAGDDDVHAAGFVLRQRRIA